MKIQLAALKSHRILWATERKNRTKQNKPNERSNTILWIQARWVRNSSVRDVIYFIPFKNII